VLPVNARGCATETSETFMFKVLCRARAIRCGQLAGGGRRLGRIAKSVIP